MKKITFIFALGFSVNTAFANDLTNADNYKPGGPYRMFGAGRGTVEKVQNNIRKTASASHGSGPTYREIQQYSGYLTYEQRFSNHPLSEHGPFVNDRTMDVDDFHSSIINGKPGVIKARIIGREVHPDDAYDAADGGDHPYDAYYYYVHGTVQSTSIRPVEQPKMPTVPNSFGHKGADVEKNGNTSPENNTATKNDRTRDLVGAETAQNASADMSSNNQFNSDSNQPYNQDITKNGQGWNNVSPSAGAGGSFEAMAGLGIKGSWGISNEGLYVAGAITAGPAVGISANANLSGGVGGSPDGIYAEGCGTAKGAFGAGGCAGFSQHGGTYVSGNMGIGAQAGLYGTIGYAHTFKRDKKSSN